MSVTPAKPVASLLSPTLSNPGQLSTNNNILFIHPLRETTSVLANRTIYTSHSWSNFTQGMKFALLPRWVFLTVFIYCTSLHPNAICMLSISLWKHNYIRYIIKLTFQSQATYLRQPNWKINACYKFPSVMQYFRYKISGLNEK